MKKAAAFIIMALVCVLVFSCNLSGGGDDSGNGGNQGGNQGGKTPSGDGASSSGYSNGMYLNAAGGSFDFVHFIGDDLEGFNEVVKSEDSGVVVFLISDGGDNSGVLKSYFELVTSNPQFMKVRFVGVDDPDSDIAKQVVKDGTSAGVTGFRRIIRYVGEPNVETDLALTNGNVYPKAVIYENGVPKVGFEWTDGMYPEETPKQFLETVLPDPKKNIELKAIGGYRHHYFNDKGDMIEDSTEKYDFKFEIVNDGDEEFVILTKWLGEENSGTSVITIPGTLSGRAWREVPSERKENGSVVVVDGYDYNDIDGMLMIVPNDRDSNGRIDDYGYYMPYEFDNLPVRWIGNMSLYEPFLSLRVHPEDGYPFRVLLEDKGGAWLNDLITEVNIPKETRIIDAEAFSNCFKLEKVNFESGSELEEIRESAFHIYKNPEDTAIQGSLKSITLPNGLKLIGNTAFAYQALESISIPESVIGMGQYQNASFMECNRIRSITLPEGTTSFFGAFTGLKDLTDLSFLPSTIKWIGTGAFSGWNITDEMAAEIFSRAKGVESLSSRVFEGTKITNLDFLPNTVRSIGDMAFANCYDLLDVTVPASVEHIGEFAFYLSNPGWVKIFNPYWNTIRQEYVELYADDPYMKEMVPDLDGYTLNFGTLDAEHNPDKDKPGFIDANERLYRMVPKRTVKFASGSKLEAIPVGCFQGNYNIKTMDDLGFPENLKIIGDSSYYGNSGFRGDLILPNSVEVIETSAFWTSNDVLYKLGHIDSVNFGNSVKRIGSNKLGSLLPSSVKRVSIPATLEELGRYVFDGNTLEEILYSGTKSQWNSIKKASDWDFERSSYVVRCSDGDISPSGN